MSLSLKNVKDSEICPCAKFRFNYIFVARNIANKHFSLKKPLTQALNTLSIKQTEERKDNSNDNNAKLHKKIMKLH